jgi:hypothetical protein
MYKKNTLAIIFKLLISTTISITFVGCASTASNVIETGAAKVDPNNVGLSVQYSLTDQAFKVKPFYSPSAQEATKPNLIKPTQTTNPSASADPMNPPLEMDVVAPVPEPTQILPE